MSGTDLKRNRHGRTRASRGLDDATSAAVTPINAPDEPELGDKSIDGDLYKNFMMVDQGLALAEHHAEGPPVKSYQSSSMDLGASPQADAQASKAFHVFLWIAMYSVIKKRRNQRSTKNVNKIRIKRGLPQILPFSRYCRR